MRQQAVLAFGRLGEPEAAPLLLPLLAEDDPRLRFVAVRALGQIRNPEAVAHLLPFLAEPRKELRFAAVEALGEIRAPAAVRPLIEVLRDADRNLRRAAAESLGEIADPQAAAALLLALEDEHWSVRCAAAAALGRIGSAKAVPALLARLDDDDATVRRAAVAALGEIRDARAARRASSAPSPIRASSRPPSRRCAASAPPPCPRWSGPSPRERSTPEVRRLLVDLAGRLEDPAARRLLLAGLDDASPAVRAEAAAGARRRGLPRGAAAAHGPEGERPLARGPPGRRQRPEEAAAAVRSASTPTTTPSSAKRSSGSSATSSTSASASSSTSPQRACLRTRLAPRLALLGLLSFEDYYRYLRFGPERAEEQQRMVSHLTNNETYFFREQPQLSVFSDHVLRAIKERKAKTGEKRLHAALRRLLDRGGAAHPGHDPLRQRPVLLGLGRAGHRPRRGRGRARQGPPRRLPPELVPRHVTRRCSSGTSPRTGAGVRVKEAARKAVSFRRATSSTPRATTASRPSTSIFCRNVLIYFSDAAMLRAVRLFHEALAPGGYLFLGHAESLARVSTGFIPIRFQGAMVYQKPEEPAS